MSGLLAGAILRFAVDTFIELREEPVIVGTVLVVFLLGRRFIEPRIPALLPALVAGIVAVGITGEFGSVSGAGSYATPTLTTPELSLQAILTVMPVMVSLMTVQANIPSMVFLRDQGYDPLERSVNVASGAGTMAGSLLGPSVSRSPSPPRRSLQARMAGRRSFATGRSTSWRPAPSGSPCLPGSPPSWRGFFPARCWSPSSGSP